MAEYTYTGASPRMLFGLAQGVQCLARTGRR